MPVALVGIPWISAFPEQKYDTVNVFVPGKEALDPPWWQIRSI